MRAPGAARDLAADALLGVASRLGRSMLTLAGTALGVAGLVATTGLAASAADQVAGTFDQFAASAVTFRDSASEVAPLPADVDERLEALNGVRAGGWTCSLTNLRLLVGAPGRDDDTAPPPVVAMSPGAVAALEPTWTWGASYQPVHEARRDDVALVGRGLASSLQLADASNDPVVLVAGRALRVVGVIDDVKRRPDVLNAVVIPRGLATGAWHCDEPAELVVATSLGAAELIGRQAPYAVVPDQPDRLLPVVAPDARLVRREVEADVSALYLMLAALSIAVGGLAIANTMTVSVLERTGELGLRRALGSTPGDLRRLLLVEATTVGVLGGVLGASAGVIVSVGAAVGRGWSPSVAVPVLLASPLLGALTGVIGGAIPAIRASRIEPASALRQ